MIASKLEASEPTHPTPGADPILIGCAVGLLGGFVVLASFGELCGGGLALALPLMLLLGLPCLLAAARTSGRQTSGGALGFILIVALIARLLLVPTTPGLSDDVYRYIWEGRVQNAGFNPYLLAPDSPALVELRDGIWVGVNHKPLAAIYPPLTQRLFQAVTALGGGVTAIKLVLALIDLGVCLLIIALLRRAGRDPGAVVLYAWHPLPIIEVAGQGHFEPLVMLPLLGSLLALDGETPRRGLSVILLWLSVAAKYLPIGIAPVLLRRQGLGRALLGPLVLILLLLPYLGDGFGGALGKYGSQWRFNDWGFLVLDELLRATGLATLFATELLPKLMDTGGLDPANHQTWLSYPARLVVAGLAGLLVLTMMVRNTEPKRAALLFFSLFCLFTPVLHPWYLLWIVMLLPFFSNLSWLTLTLLIPLSYEILLRFDGRGATWQEALWVKQLIFSPFFVLLPLTLARQRAALAGCATPAW